ncbi:MAG: hypothetical protein ACR2HD_05630 [Solirubrobacteraceae bacterium]|nr:MAG: hypothetical protein DLM63_03270 [Solirubrobacterales bacterium]
MAKIIVQSDAPGALVTHQERVCSGELESDHFSRQLIERVSRAVSDAEEAERDRVSKSARDRGDASTPSG